MLKSCIKRQAFREGVVGMVSRMILNRQCNIIVVYLQAEEEVDEKDGEEEVGKEEIEGGNMVFSV